MANLTVKILTAGPGYLASSTTSVAIGTGSKTFSTQPGLAYSVGARARASYVSTPTDYVEGLVTSYSGTTLVINVDTVGGSGTFAVWSINVSGNAGIGAPGAWQTPTLLNSWANVGGGFSLAGYRLEVDGVTVRLRGTLVGGTVTHGTVIFVVPSGYYATTYTSQLSVAGSTSAPQSVTVDSSGNVSINTVTAGFSLDGITFPTT